MKYLFLSLCTLLIPAQAFSSSSLRPINTPASPIYIWSEATIDNESVTVDVYATSTIELRSYGIRIHYDPTAFIVDENATQRDSAAWRFGDENRSYSGAPPVYEKESVAILGGRADASRPTAGNSGDVLFLGSVHLKAKDGMLWDGIPSLRVGPAYDQPFTNFADVEMYDRDFDVEYEHIYFYWRGDVDGNWRINKQDGIALSQLLKQGGPFSRRCDVNGDLRVDRADLELLMQ